MDVIEIRKAVTDRYGRIAKGEGNCCGTGDSTLDLGLESPLDHVELRAGDHVLDLGSGGGREVFEAAKRVGPTGSAIGVDATPEMVWRAREEIKRRGATNVEFRLGEIEALPMADASMDVVVSNCVINLSPEKEEVFSEAHRILRPGGRLVISDVVLREGGSVPPGSQWPECAAGAVPISQYQRWLEASGFEDVEVSDRGTYCGGDVELREAIIKARKPL